VAPPDLLDPDFSADINGMSVLVDPYTFVGAVRALRLSFDRR